MIVIEVAFFISILSDAAGADDGRRKEKMPKALDYCGFVLGHTAKNCMTVIEYKETFREFPKMGSYPRTHEVFSLRV